jgi:methionyl aminopeptidase
MIIYIKKKEDIELFKKVGEWTAEILSKLLEEAKEGVTTRDLDLIARNECERLGVVPVFLNYRGFPAAICASVNEILVHGTPNDKELKNGDILSIDIGTDRLGYIGDTAESIVIGGGQSDIVDKCRLALNKGMDKAIAGNRLSDIAEAIQKIGKKAKYSIALGYGGHGIDRYVLHADPFVSNIPDESENDIKLRPGMIIAIEPMLIDSKSGETRVSKADGWSVIAGGMAAHCEHTILITDKEPLILTDRRKYE